MNDLIILFLGLCALMVLVGILGGLMYSFQNLREDRVIRRVRMRDFK